MTMEEGERLICYCPVCDSSSVRMDARTVRMEGHLRLAHLHCRKCAHGVLALVLVNRVGASSVGVLTDLAYEDALRFQDAPPIALNDVIDVHLAFGEAGWTGAAPVKKRHAKVTRLPS